MQSEIWRDIAETDGLYEVSSCGKVRRKVGVVAFGHTKRKVGGKILSPKTKSNGYLEVNLRFNGKGHSRYVHRLVALAFLPKPKETVNHKDGNKANNNIDNLEWCTNQENITHAMTLGLMCLGEDSYNTNLKNKDVIDIRAKYETGSYTRKQLAEEFKTTPHNIGRIIRKERWKHI